MKSVKRISETYYEVFLIKCLIREDIITSKQDVANARERTREITRAKNTIRCDYAKIIQDRRFENNWGSLFDKEKREEEEVHQCFVAITRKSLPTIRNCTDHRNGKMRNEMEIRLKPPLESSRVVRCIQLQSHVKTVLAFGNARRLARRRCSFAIERDSTGNLLVLT